jgi:hypothetical protein
MSKTDTTHSSQEAVNALDLSVLTQLYSKCLVDALESVWLPLSRLQPDYDARNRSMDLRRWLSTPAWRACWVW